jgi:hypothetical protein
MFTIFFPVVMLTLKWQARRSAGSAISESFHVHELRVRQPNYINHGNVNSQSCALCTIKGFLCKFIKGIPI